MKTEKPFDMYEFNEKKIQTFHLSAIYPVKGMDFKIFNAFNNKLKSIIGISENILAINGA